VKSFAALLASIFLAVICWGVYGPVLQSGKVGMEGSSLKPFICVGLAYFIIAVVAPLAIMRAVGEPGRWSTPGIIWSLAAGAAGAIGALGIILALAFHGNPLYVMPLVFGGAPVVNTFLTMYWGKTFRQVSSIFIAGLILVIAGAMIVLVFRPQTHAPAAAAPIPAPEATAEEQGNSAHPILRAEAQWGAVLLFTAMTALAWGVYGPTLHRGQMGMGGSRLRPLICVGAAYFVIAVVVPTLILLRWDEPGHFTFSGTVWSLLGGTAGAVGALGIIMAFNFGGKPIFVMPLVFGGAPVVNTFVSVIQAGNYDQLHPLFFAGLIVVAAGAVTVLIFAPKTAVHGAPAGAGHAAETAPV
jgi:hypothetical protein